MPEPIVLCFSGGKDSLLALRELQRGGEWEIVALLTTVTEEFDRVSMHGVRRSLLRRQAESLGIPLVEVGVPPKSSNEIYEREMGRAFARFRQDGIATVAFGDIFLEDLRVYREGQLRAAGLNCRFPLWKRETAQLADEFCRDGFRAVTACVNPAVLDHTFVGREYDRSFLRDLPAEVDSCGENGEFHTFVYDGPNFAKPIPVQTGAVVERDDFVYCDIMIETANRLTSSGSSKESGGQ